MHHGVKYTSLYDGVTKRGGEFPGTGVKCSVLTMKEEILLRDHVLYKAKIGYGDSWKTLRTLVQTLLVRMKTSSPQRMTGLEDRGQRPSISWVRRFAQRNNISLRKCSVISKGRAVISPKDNALWFRA